MGHPAWSSGEGESEDWRSQAASLTHSIAQNAIEWGTPAVVNESLRIGIAGCNATPLNRTERD
jgi:hypothetical protein